MYDSSEEEDNQNKRAKHAGRNYNLFFINNVVLLVVLSFHA